MVRQTRLGRRQGQWPAASVNLDTCQIAIRVHTQLKPTSMRLRFRREHQYAHRPNRNHYQTYIELRRQWHISNAIEQLHRRIHDGSNTEHQRHHEDWFTAKIKSQNDPQSTNGSCRSTSKRPDRPSHLPTSHLTRGNQDRSRNEHSDHQVGQSDTQQGAQATPLHLHLASMQDRTVNSPAQCRE